MSADEVDQNIVDVLDNFFGGVWGPASVDRLSDDEVDALAHTVEDFYYDFSLSQPNESIRSYSGGAAWISNQQPPLDGSARRVSVSSVLPFSHASVLYADQVLFDCPLDAWIFGYRDSPAPGELRARDGMIITPIPPTSVYGAGYFHSDMDESRSRMGRALARLDAIAPAIRAGWLIPIPHLRCWKKRMQEIVTSVRYDIRDTDLAALIQGDYETPPAMSDAVRGMMVVPRSGFHPDDALRAVVETPAIYFNSLLAVADSYSARFLPTADSDYCLALHKLKQAAAQNRVLRDGVSVESVRNELLPAFDSENFDTVCDIRRSEQLFEDWRVGLRELVSGGIGSSVSRSPMDIRAVALDLVSEQFNLVRRGIARSRTLSGRLDFAKATREVGIDVGLAAVIWAIPPESSIPKLIAGALAPLLKRAVMSFAPPRDASPRDALTTVVMRFERPGRSSSV